MAETPPGMSRTKWNGSVLEELGSADLAEPRPGQRCRVHQLNFAQTLLWEGKVIARSTFSVRVKARDGRVRTFALIAVRLD